MTDISNLANITRATLLSGGTIASAEHNAWSQNVITALTNLNAVFTGGNPLLKMPAISAPGTPAAGKGNAHVIATDAWGIANSAWRHITDGGTIWEHGGSVARTLGGVGLDITNSNTGLTSTSSQAIGATLALPANALNANGRAYRVIFFADTNNAVATATIQARFNSAVICRNAGTGSDIMFAPAGTKEQASLTVVICRISPTQATISVEGRNSVAGTVAGIGVNSATPIATITVTNWTSAINFDVNISAWTSGTIRSMIIGEQIG